MDKRLTFLILGLAGVIFTLGMTFLFGVADSKLKSWREEAVMEVQQVLNVANQQIAELEGHLRVCETTIAWEDSCCAIQSRCLERNAQLERSISDCSTASPDGSERQPASRPSP